MIPKGLLMQIAITILSVGIIASYVKPTFDLIDKNQNQIGVYKEELVKVAEVNDKLSKLSASMSSIDAADQKRLLTYMPDTVDTIVVPRTLEAIAKESGVILRKVSNESEDSNKSSVEEVATSDPTLQPKAVMFTMGVEGSYAQLKKLLQLLEQNDYPLEVTSLKITKLDGGFLGVTLTITTYSRQLPGESDTINEVTS
jgi:hypothetical protein